MRKILFLLAIFFLSLSTRAQTFSFTVIVIDSISGESLPGTIIKPLGQKGAQTDTSGKVVFNLPKGNYTIELSAIGYKTKSLNFALQANLLEIIKLSPDDAQLEVVVVSAGRYEQKVEEVSVSISVLKSDLIENKNTVNSETILEQVPGVTVQDGQVSIRGGSGFAYGAGSRVLMVVDDMPLLSGDAGDIKFNAIPVENIEQIEVMKGASSVLYGSSALNGVVHIRTAYPRAKPLTKINFTSGVYCPPRRDSIKWWDSNPYFNGLTFLHSRQINQLDLVAGGAYYGDKGYREGEEEFRGRLNVSMRYRSKRHKGLNYGLNAGGQKAKGGLFVIWENENQVYQPSGGANPDSAGSTLSRFDNDRFNVDPYLNYYTKKGNKHTLRGRWFNTTNRNETDTTDQGSVANMCFAEYQYLLKMKNDFTLTTGMAGYLNFIEAALYGDHQGSNVAAFAQADKKWNRLNVSAGVRLEYYQLDGEETISSYKIIKGNDTTTFPVQPVFRAGANYRLGKATYLRSSFGQGYRYPTVAEKYVRTNVGALQLFPNADLQAETGWSAELGVKQMARIGNWKGYLDVAGFVTEYDNMVEFTFGVYNPSNIALSFDPNDEGYIFNWVGFRSENAERARISGIDIELAGTGKVGQTQLTVYAGYTYMNPVTLNDDSAYRATFSDSLTTMLKYRYKHLVKGDVQLDYKKISVGASVRYNSFMSNVDKTFYNLQIPVGGGYFISLGDYLLKGYPKYRERFNKGNIIFDARFFWNLNENSRLGIIANNVFNVEYMGRPGDVGAPLTISAQYILKF